jgi:hypothetical protein
MADGMRSTQELDEPENQPVYHREWIAERIGWLVIAALLIAAALGLLGPGLLSHRLATSSDGRLSVEYYSTVRSEAPATLKIRVQPAGNGDRIRLAISERFLEAITPEAIVPEPEATEVGDDRVVHVFRVADLTEDGLITYRFRFDDFGPVSYQLSVPSGSEIELFQFVCP